jgi:hypothetical protein
VQTVRLSGTVTDDDLSSVAVSFSGVATGSTAVDANGHFQFQRTGTDLSLVYAAASDGAGLTSDTVQADLSGVSLTNPGDQTNLAGDGIYFGLSASAANGDSLTYDAAGLPLNVGVNSSNGIVSGTIANNAADGSPYTATVTAFDPLVNAGVMQTFTWTVNPPVVTLNNQSPALLMGFVV